MRWLVAQFMHESNTFSNIHPGSREFSEREFLMGREIAENLRGTRTLIGAFIDFAGSHGVELVWTVAAFATPAGRVQSGFYDYVGGQIMDAVTDDIDAVLLSLHGAMVVEDRDDGEGVLLEAIRRKLGPERPIATSLDYHANLSEKMVANADVLVGYKTYPHVDMYEAGYASADVLFRTVRCEVDPVRHAERPPILAPLGNTSTLREPMKSVLDRAREIESEAGVLSVSVFGGFPFADVRDAGMSTLVLTDGNLRDDGKMLAKELSDMLWSRRREFLHEATPVAEAVQRAIAAPRGPVILADVADNPGGGGANDGVEILRELLERDAQDAAVATIRDVDAVRFCDAAGRGAKVDLDVGARTDDLHGKPVRLKGEVVWLGDAHFVYGGPMDTGVRRSLGRTAVVKSGGVEVIICTNRLQNVDPVFFRCVGIEPTERKVLLVKSSIHYRAAYEPLAAEIIEVDAPGLVSPNLKRFDFRHVRRPIFPLDDI